MTPATLKKHRKSLAALVPEAIEGIAKAMKEDASIAQLRCFELVLRNSGVCIDGRIIDRQQSKAKAGKRGVVIRYNRLAVDDGKE